jgi:hypothetical protein
VNMRAHEHQFKQAKLKAASRKPGKRKSSRRTG